MNAPRTNLLTFSEDNKSSTPYTGESALLRDLSNLAEWREPR